MICEEIYIYILYEYARIRAYPVKEEHYFHCSVSRTLTQAKVASSFSHATEKEYRGTTVAIFPPSTNNAEYDVEWTAEFVLVFKSAASQTRLPLWKLLLTVDCKSARGCVSIPSDKIVYIYIPKSVAR